MVSKKYATLAVLVVILLAVHFFVFPLDRLFTLIVAEKYNCGPGDEDCLQKVNSVRGNCTPPSVSIVTIGNETNNITIQTTTYMKDGKCVTEEIVLEDANSAIAPFDITGYNTTCEVEEEKLEVFGQHACNGSIMAYISGDEEVGGEPEEDEYVYQAYCSLEAENCKEEAAQYIKNCDESQITMDMEINHTQGGVSYWTIYIEITELPLEYTELGKLPARCQMYHELINAVNLPPEIPPSIIGMAMTCEIELSKFPIDAVTASYCDGDLLDYIQLIYP